MFPPDHQPSGSVEDAFALIERGLEMLARERRSGWSASAKSATLVALDGVFDRLRAERVRAVGEWDGDRSWEADGALSAPSWLVAHTNVSKQEARQLVRTARLAHRQDRVGSALAAGDLAPSQVEVLANATKGRTALLERDVDTLVDVAGTLSVDDYATAMKQWRSLADDEMARTDALLAFHERSVTWVTTLDGRVEFRISLDAEGGATVIKALEAYDRPDPEPADGGAADGGAADGPRTVRQRHADGLVQMSSESLQRHERGGRHTPGVEGLIDVACLGGAGAGTAEGVPVAAPGELTDWLRSRCELTGIGPVARDVLTRLVCDAAVGRVVMRGESEVLDIGRRARVVNRALHRAIELRDRHCTFPGCDAPLGWCDVHHLVHWADGGATDLDNCTLLCRRHHVLCHEGGWQLARGPDGQILIVMRGRRPRRRRPGGPPDRGGGYDLAA